MKAVNIERRGDCLAVCPSNILLHEGAHGYPTVDFTLAVLSGRCRIPLLWYT